MTHEFVMKYLQLCRDNPKKAALYAAAFIIFLIIMLFINKKLDNNR